jgi:hypothetical protein
MFRQLFRRNARLMTAGEKARRLHSTWLTYALADPGRFPRIPARKVSDGGFARLVANPRGRAWADGWWSDTFDSLED